MAGPRFERPRYHSGRFEDAAHAHGAMYKGRKVGTFGDCGSFSFQSSKNLTAGEGGIIVSNDEKYVGRCRSFHNCGRLPEGPWYEHHLIGGNYRLSELCMSSARMRQNGL